eukprot:scaffold1438_cov173-Ochromonas_danica.AAC.7
MMQQMRGFNCFSPLLRTTFFPSRSFAVTGRHSKKVALTKNRSDALKNKLYTRLGVKILMAAKAGGTDPSKNSELARVLKEAQSIKLPKDNIERALTKASDTSLESYSVGLYEVFGYGGVGLVVTTLTDSPNRAVKEIKALARKSDVKIASAGSAVFVPQQSFDKDAILEQALNVEISDVQFTPQNTIHNDSNDDDKTSPPPELIVANADELGLLQDLVSHSQLSGSTSLAYLPTELVKVSAEDMEKNIWLIEDFEELDDVDAVYHNMRLE